MGMVVKEAARHGQDGSANVLSGEDPSSHLTGSWETTEELGKQQLRDGGHRVTCTAGWGVIMGTITPHGQYFG